MEILIIEPPAVSKFGNQRIFGGNGSNKSDFRKPPLDLMMISGYLSNNGFNNDILDANASKMTLEDVGVAIKKKKPGIVFFSSSTCTIYKDVLLADLAKKIDPLITTVGIGTHFMALPEETMELTENLDAAILSNEWEMVSLSLVQNLGSLSNVKGIIFRRKDGKLVKTLDQEPMIDLDELGFPAHDKLNQSLYNDPLIRKAPKTMVMGQKACTNDCSFCCQPAFFGKIRHRSVNNFIKELQWVKKLGFNEVMFNDATLTANREWAEELFQRMIKENINLVWNCSTRVDKIDDHLLKLMKRAGCHTIMYGMESVNTTILKNVRKNVSSDQIKRAVALTKKNGIDSLVFCVVGFPGETKDSITETISFLKTLDTNYITLGIAVPAPGTDFYRHVEKNGYLRTKDWSQYDPLKEPVFSYPELSSKEIVYYSAYGLRQFYLQPRFIVQRFFAINSFSRLVSDVKHFIGFMKRYVISSR